MENSLKPTVSVIRVDSTDLSPFAPPVIQELPSTPTPSTRIQPMDDLLLTLSPNIDESLCPDMSGFSNEELLALPSEHVDTFAHTPGHESPRPEPEDNDSWRPVAIVHGNKMRIHARDDATVIQAGQHKRAYPAEWRSPGSVESATSSASSIEHSEGQGSYHIENHNIGSNNVHLQSPGSSPEGQSSILNQMLNPPTNQYVSLLPPEPQQHHFVSPPSYPPRVDIRNEPNSLVYILAVPTSMATKRGEESLTYLNQFQSYEVKLRRPTPNPAELRGIRLRSTLTLHFHERRHLFMERELFEEWQTERGSERILELDVPLSYGLSEITHEPTLTNRVAFTWEPARETGVYFKLNCVSTEFAQRKHGGEKGAPFRLTIETHVYEGWTSKFGPSSRLHMASCQVKVFKPRGSDRKHKADWEKMARRGPVERAEFAPGSSATVFTEQGFEFPVLDLYANVVEQKCVGTTAQNATSECISKMGKCTLKAAGSQVPSCPNVLTTPKLPPISGVTGLRADASTEEVTEWLHRHRFDKYSETFKDFAGADLLRLSKDEVVEICGLADGLRFYNGLHSRSIKPKLTLYVSDKPDKPFRAIYLDSMTLGELTTKLSETFTASTFNIEKVCFVGAAGVRVFVTDEVLVKEVVKENTFLVQFEKLTGAGNCYKAMLRYYNIQTGQVTGNVFAS